MIFSLWKPLGVSTHSFVKLYGDKIGVKMTHTGSLDPMAEGVVVVLTGEDRFLKEKYANSDKEYEFEVLIGVSTDSHDLLGLITDHATINLSISEITGQINRVIPKYIGTTNQIIPDFSAKRINGESYFDLAKRGEILPGVSVKVTINSLGIVDFSAKNKDEIFQQIQARINIVQGDFRQKLITQGWKQYFNNLKNVEKLTIVRLKAITSKRTYIRGLVRDIAKELKIPMVTYSIIRTSNGTFTKSDCINNK